MLQWQVALAMTCLTKCSVQQDRNSVRGTKSRSVEQSAVLSRIENTSLNLLFRFVHLSGLFCSGLVINLLFWYGGMIGNRIILSMF